jgi:hypothetical protein
MIDYGEELKNAQPRWMADGGGLRGNAPVDFPVTRHDVGSGKAEMQSASLIREAPATVAGNLGAPLVSGGSYPWMGQAYDATNGGWNAWLGSGWASFVSGTAAELEGLQMVVTPPSGTSSMVLTVGDSTASNDGLFFEGPDSSALGLTWTDGGEVDCTDSDGNLASLIGNSLEFDDGSGNQMLALGYDDSIGDGGGYGLIIGATTLSDGDLDLGTDGSIELGDDGSGGTWSFSAKKIVVCYLDAEGNKLNGTLVVLADDSLLGS